MPKKVREIAFPRNGLVEVTSYSDQPPTTTPGCLNVMPFDASEERVRGGSRPGLSLVYGQSVGSAGWMTSVSYVPGTAIRSLSDTFVQDPVDSTWTAASWATDGILTHDSVFINTVSATTGEERAMVYDVIPLDSTASYSIYMYLLAPSSATNVTYYMYARMNDSTPDADTDCVELALTVTGGSFTFSGTLKTIVSGSVSSVNATLTATASPLGTGVSPWLKITLNGTSIDVVLNGNTIASETMSGPDATALSGKRFGVGITSVAARAYITTVTGSYTSTETSPVALKALAYLNNSGTLYFESSPNVMALHGSVQPSGVGTGERLYMVEYNQKLYIAAGGAVVLTGTDGTNNGTTLTATAHSDWIADGVTLNRTDVVIFDGAGDVVDGQYGISTVSPAGTINLDETASGTTDACSYNINYAHQIYDPVAKTSGPWDIGAYVQADVDAGTESNGAVVTVGQHKGLVPERCKLITRWNDRIIMAGEPAHIWYMSRQGDPNDWDFFLPSDDAQRAVAGTNADMGGIGLPITALIAHSADYLIFGAATEIWVMRGDPAQGGSLANISRTIGILDGYSWCHTALGDLVFLSNEGLYILPSGIQSNPIPLTKGRVPARLLNVTPADTYVGMAWDSRFNGIYLSLTPVAGGLSVIYWIDWNTKSIWPCEINNSTLSPAGLLAFPDRFGGDGVLLGCQDGLIREFSDTATSDDGTAITSHVFIGPIYPGDDAYMDGLLIELDAIIGSASGSIDWSLHLGDNAEDALAATAAESGTWTSSDNIRRRPRRRARCMFIKLANNGTDPWALEKVTAVTRPFTSRRLPA